MNMPFYVGAIGIGSCTKKLGVIPNSLANANDTGSKPRPAVFSGLINYNLSDSPEAVIELQAGVGIRIQRASTGSDVGGLAQAGSRYDYVITQANALFAVQDPETGEQVLIGDGRFHRGEWDGGFYLMAESGKLVLDQNQEPIRLDVLGTEKIREGIESGYELEDEDGDEDEGGDKPKVNLYTFTSPSRPASAGDNEFSADNTGTEPALVE